jgi:hypothetical protein
VTRAHAPRHSPFLLALEEAIAMARGRAHSHKKTICRAHSPQKNAFKRHLTTAACNTPPRADSRIGGAARALSLVAYTDLLAAAGRPGGGAAERGGRRSSSSAAAAGEVVCEVMKEAWCFWEAGF